MSIPELKGTVVGNCYKLSIIDFDHLVDTRLMFFNAFDRSEFNTFVSVLHTEVIIFNLWLNLAQEVDGAATQLGYHTVNDILVRVVAQNLNL